MKKTAYEILGVSPNASDEEIKKAYHTLVRGVHSDVTDLKDLSLEEKARCEALIREYTGAYGELSKGKRAEYDKTLASEGKASHTVTKNNSKVDLSFVREFDQMCQEVFVKGYAFYGSKTTDPEEKIKQEYFRLKSSKEILEKKLRNLQFQEEMKQTENRSVNPFQVQMNIRTIHSSISELEIQKQNEVTFSRLDYTNKMNKPFVTKRKKEQLEEEMHVEIAQINAKYQALIDEKNKQIAELEKKIKEQEKEQKKAVDNNPEIQKIKANIEQVRQKIDRLAEQLGYQTQSTSYQSSYNVHK